MKRIDEPDVHPMEREAILRIRPCGVYESDETTIVVLRAFAQQVALATIDAYERELMRRLPGAPEKRCSAGDAEHHPRMRREILRELAAVTIGVAFLLLVAAAPVTLYLCARGFMKLATSYPR